MSNKFLQFTLIALFFTPLSIQAQQEQVLHFRRELFQSSFTNPALVPTDYKVHVALPSFYMNALSPVAIEDMIILKNNKRIFSFNNPAWLEKLQQDNVFESNVHLQTLGLSFPIKKSGLRVNLHHAVKADARFTFRREVMDLMFRGNAPLVGYNVNLNSSLSTALQNEFGAGLSYAIENFKVGVRFRGLTGLTGAFTERDKLQLYTDTSHYALDMEADYQLKTFENNFDKGYRRFAESGGVAMDVGFSVKLQRLEFALSANGLGRGIFWRNGGKEYTLKGNVQYEGQKNISINAAAFDKINGELKDNLNYSTADYTTYRQAPNLNVYASALYQLTPTIRTGGLFYLENNGFGNRYGVTIDATAQLWKVLNLGVAYGMRNEEISIVGLHGSVRVFDCIQLYAMTDNILPYLKPYATTAINGRAGINLTFGNIDKALKKANKARPSSKKSSAPVKKTSDKKKIQSTSPRG
jgi:Family of unknown function (DUF5723)